MLTNNDTKPQMVVDSKKWFVDTLATVEGSTPTTEADVMLSRPLSAGIIMLTFFFVTGPSSALAEPLDVGRLPNLPRVKVEAPALFSLSGEASLNRTQLKLLANPRGQTNDLLRLFPGVQLSESAYSSNTAGEIAPVAFSISGGRAEANNFLIDGMGNNSLLDPGQRGNDQISDVTGHAQQFFLDPNLLENIRVLRSNISARYGQFTGGVVEADTLAPDTHFGGQLNYRTTSSELSHFQLDDDKREKFKNSASADNQPEFVKQNLSAVVHTPINTHSGAVVSYALQHAAIPLHNFGQRQTQKRQSQNFFAKYHNDLNLNHSLTVSALYAPYTADYFIKTVKNSSYEIQGGGTQLSAKFGSEHTLGQSSLALAFQKSHNSRNSPPDFFNWKTTPTKDWGTTSFSREGGYGDIDKSEQSLIANINHAFTQQQFAGSRHEILGGLETTWIQTQTRRPEALNIYSATLDENVSCANDQRLCIDNEQYFNSKTTYPTDKATADILLTAIYLEDDLALGRLKLRPGIRLSWDNYIQQLNNAPRLAAGYDLFANGQSLLIGGINRYYGANLLGAKLVEQKRPFEKYTRELDEHAIPTAWIFDRNGSISYRQKTPLKTPYTDEWTLGFKQRLWQGELSFDYLQRKGHDLLVTNRYDADPDPQNVSYFKEWRNDGKSTHQEVNLGWSRQFERQFFSLHASWQKTRANSQSYDDTFNDSEENLAELIWYEGKIGTREDLLVEDFNRPVSIVLIYAAEPWGNLRFSNTTNYRSAYKTTEKTGEIRQLDEQTTAEVYENVKNDHALTFDWHLAAKIWPQIASRNALWLTLDLYNVFDQRTKLGKSESDYELGRQLWLGATYRF